MLPILTPLTAHIRNLADGQTDHGLLAVPTRVRPYALKWSRILQDLSRWQSLAEPILRSLPSGPVIGSCVIVHNKKARLLMLGPAPIQVPLPAKLFSFNSAPPQLYQDTFELAGILCTIILAQEYLRNKQFTYTLTSPHLTTLLQGKRHEPSRELVNVIEVIHKALVKINALSLQPQGSPRERASNSAIASNRSMAHSAAFRPGCRPLHLHTQTDQVDTARTPPPSPRSLSCPPPFFPFYFLAQLFGTIY